MGSKEEEVDPCMVKLAKNSKGVLYEDTCPKKTMYLSLAGTGIVGPKFRRVKISGDAAFVEEIKNLITRSYS